MAERKISTKFAISGESEYRSAVKAINSEMKTLSSEMAKVTSEFLDNQNSMEALSAKADVLGRQYETQSERVETMREALQNAKDAQQEWAEKVESAGSRVEELTQELEELQDAEGDTSEEQARLREEIEQATEAQEAAQRGYDAATKGVEDWQVRLNYAEADLNKLNQKVQENEQLLDEARNSADGCATSIDQYGKSVQGAGEGSSLLGELGAQAVGKITGALTTGGLLGLTTKLLGTVKDLAIETKNAEAIMVRGTGASGDALRELNTVYQEVMANAKTASDAVAGSIAALNTRLNLTGDNLTDATLQFEKFARATGTDTVQATEAVIDMMNAFGKSSEELPYVLDLLTVAAQSSDASVTTLASALSNSAFYAKEYGLSMEETLAIMAAAENAQQGLSGVLSRGMKKAYDDVTTSGKTFKQVLTELSDGTLSASDAMDMFGNKGANVVEFLRNGTMDIDAMAEALTNADGVMQETAANAETFADKWRGFWNSIWHATEASGSQYTGFYTTVTEGNEEMANTFEERVTPSFDEAAQKLVEMTMASDGSAESIDALTQYLESDEAQVLRSAEGYDELKTALGETKAQMVLLEAETAAAAEGVAANLDTIMGRFNQVPYTAARSTVDVIASLQTQMTYMDTYATNMQIASARGVDQGLLKSLSDGSQESAEILAGIVNATDGEILVLNEKWNQTQTGRENFSRTLGEMQTDFEERSAALKGEYDGAVSHFNQYSQASANAMKTAMGAVSGAAQYMAGTGNSSYYNMGRSAAQSFANGFSSVPQPNPKTGYASGTDYASAGFAWVGENGPEILLMRGGETVLNHAESMALAREAMTAAALADKKSITANLEAPDTKAQVIVMPIDTKGIEDRIEAVEDAVKAQEPIQFSALTSAIDRQLGRSKRLMERAGG